jgi:general secretion pathway protein J
MLRARDYGQQAIERTARINTILAQWEQDLQALHDTGSVPALAFDGQTLRLTRTTRGGVVLVAWSLHGSRWMRWSSQPTTRVAELQEVWMRSQQLLGNEAAQVPLLDNVGEWQVYLYRGNGWSNAQSTGDVSLAPAGAASSVVAREALADGVRLVVSIGGQTLTRDIALGPQGSS